MVPLQTVLLVPTCFSSACPYMVMSNAITNTTCDDDTPAIIAPVMDGECGADNMMLECSGSSFTLTNYSNADCSGDETDLWAILKAQFGDCLTYENYCDEDSGAAQVVFKTALAVVMVATIWRV